VRIAIVDTYYPAFLAEHYSRDPGLAQQSYDSQLAALMNRSFGTADAYSHAFRALGHEAIDIVVNCDPLQHAWARDHRKTRMLARLAHTLGGSPGRLLREEFQHRVVAAQLEVFEPDVVYCQDFWFLRLDEIAALRKRNVLVVGQFGSALPPDARPFAYDLITTSFPHFVDRLRRQGLDAEYLKIAFDERVLERLDGEGVVAGASNPRDLGVVFVGGVHSRSVHRAGTEFLERLAQDLDMEIWGYVNDRLDPNSPIWSRHHGEAWGLDMYRILARTQIAINRHGDIAEGYANNMRLFEATGVGALLLTEAAANLRELFQPGREVITYSSVDELIDRARYFLENAEERIAIADAGQTRTLDEHTYGRRIPELVSMLESRLR
jgi:spore maturation protein CgeB